MNVMNVRADALTPTLSHREREKTSADFNTVLDRFPRPFGEGWGKSAHRATHVSSENAESSGSAAHND
ncbi:hypothetical protein ECZU36_04270 [Escherichia coli]|nr:hypothetical protein ECZU36_04270 [Escherichia coli]